MIPLDSLILAIREYKKAFIALAVILLLLIGGWGTHHWYTGKLEQSYNQGVMKTDEKWKKVVADNKAEQEKFRAEQQAKTDQLAARLAATQEQLKDTKENGGNKLIIYRDTPQGKSKSLDNSFIDIYNDSLGRNK